MRREIGVRVVYHLSFVIRYFSPYSLPCPPHPPIFALWGSNSGWL